MSRRALLAGLLLIASTAWAPACVIDRTGTSGSYLLRSKLDVTRERTRDLERDLAAERARIDAIEERATEARRRYADAGATVEALMEDLTHLKGQVSDFQHAIGESSELSSDLEFQLIAIDAKLAHVEAQLTERLRGYEPAPLMEIALEPEEAEPAAPPATGGDVVPASGGPGSASSSGAGASTTSSPTADASEEPAPPATEEEMFRSALVLFQQGDAKRAGGRLQAFLEKYPESTWWLEAQFMVGQCLFEMGRYKGAITEYQKVIARNEQSEWAARSMLAQGTSFEKLGTDEDLDAARVFYSEVVSLYPGTEEAARAGDRLAALGPK